jgi:hypothetical protein
MTSCRVPDDDDVSLGDTFVEKVAVRGDRVEKRQRPGSVRSEAIVDRQDVVDWRVDDKRFGDGRCQIRLGGSPAEVPSTVKVKHDGLTWQSRARACHKLERV